jgi:hypothetical protein
MSSKRGSIATVLIGVMLTFMIGAVLAGNLEQTITDMQPGMSADFNDTVADLIQYTWTGFGLAVLAILVVAGAYVLAQTGLLGAG